jgi:hypothetical protein
MTETIVMVLILTGTTAIVGMLGTAMLRASRDEAESDDALAAVNRQAVRAISVGVVWVMAGFISVAVVDHLRHLDSVGDWAIAFLCCMASSVPVLVQIGRLGRRRRELIERGWPNRRPPGPDG